MISHDKRLIFIHIPKNAGTSLESRLVDSSSECLRDQWDPRIQTTPLNHLTLQEMVEHNFISLEQARRYFKVCFVRNPWCRTISEITYLGDLLHGETYEQRIMSLCHKERYGNHIRPQVDFIDNEFGLEMDFIGRFENLTEDFQTLCELAKLTDTKPLNHLNATSHLAYQDYFSPLTRDLVARKYQADISRFGYHFQESNYS